MIQPKKDHECVTVPVIKICEEIKQMVLNKQIELKEKGLFHSKKVAIKELLIDLYNLKSTDP